VHFPLALSCFFLLPAAAQNRPTPAGVWHPHLPYGIAIVVAVVAIKTVCATPFNLLNILPKTRDIQRYSKVRRPGKSHISMTTNDRALKKLPLTMDDAKHGCRNPAKHQAYFLSS
jgi:hypothetical protein